MHRAAAEWVRRRSVVPAEARGQLGHASPPPPACFSTALSRYERQPKVVPREGQCSLRLNSQPSAMGLSLEVLAGTPHLVQAPMRNAPPSAWKSTPPRCRLAALVPPGDGIHLRQVLSRQLPFSRADVLLYLLRLRRAGNDAGNVRLAGWPTDCQLQHAMAP